MQTVKFKLSDLNDVDHELLIKTKLKELDGVLDVSVSCKTQEIILSTKTASDCEGALCILEDIGFKIDKLTAKPV
jgi:copper chaperone CopZ